MSRTMLFNTQPVKIELVADAAGFRAEASDAAWRPFTETLTALLLRGIREPVPLDTLSVERVQLRPKDEDASAPLRAFWEKELRWTAAEPPIRYWGFLRPGTDDGALMPDLALWRWLTVAHEVYATWSEARSIEHGWNERCLAAQRRVDGLRPTVDWSSGTPVTLHDPYLRRDENGLPLELPTPVLDSIEARAANFDQMHPQEPTTHIAREHVMLAIAGAGVFDPPDDGRRMARFALRPTLASWRQAALSWYELTDAIPALRRPGCTHPLASPVSLAWFRPAPFAAEGWSPTDFLRRQLDSWMEQSRDEPGYLDLYARELTGRVAWHTGVADLQQLCSAGQREPELPWEARCTARAATCTRAKHPSVGAVLAAHLVLADPQSWHGWLELGVALGNLGTSAAILEHPFTVKGKRLDRYDAIGGSRACTARAVELHPSLAGATVLKHLEQDFEDQRIFHKTPPLPLEDFPGALVDGLDRGALAGLLAALSPAIRRYVLQKDFVADVRSRGTFGS